MGIPTHGVFAVRKHARRIVLVLLSVAVAGTAAAVITFKKSGSRGAPASAARKTPLQIPAELIAAVQKDSDGDGLRDWEESVWHTDPAKADSDGDKTPDGEEVRQNRDPAKAGPDDRSAVSAGGDGSPEAELEQNLTARIGARLSADVLEGVAAGREPDINSLADAYLQNLGGVKVLDGTPRFSTADLTPAPANDILTILKFFGAIDEVWKKYFTAGQVTDVEVFLTAFQNGEGTGVADTLAPYQSGYAAAMETIRKTPVPKDLEPFALSFLNFLSKIERSAELMQGFGSDPLAAVLAVQERVELNKEFEAFIQKTITDAEPIIRKKVAEFAAQQKR